MILLYSCILWFAGLDNSIGLIARNVRRATVFASEVARQTCIVEHLGNPFFSEPATAHYPPVALFKFFSSAKLFSYWTTVICSIMIKHRSFLVILQLIFNLSIVCKMNPQSQRESWTKRICKYSPLVSSCPDNFVSFPSVWHFSY